MWFRRRNSGSRRPEGEELIVKSSKGRPSRTEAGPSSRNTQHSLTESATRNSPILSVPLCLCASLPMTRCAMIPIALG
jgi:hypothetical protein